MKISSNSPLLQFGPGHEDLREDLSVVALMGRYLWVASDEMTSLERLSTDDGQTFKNHKSFRLLEMLKLPIKDEEEEIDIEGLALHDGSMWLVGSHSAKRKKVEEGDKGSIRDKIAKLGKIERKGNRYILARIPIVENPETGEPELSASGAARLEGTEKGSELLDAIKEAAESGDDKGDPHLAPSLSMPGKENGFDIEGLALAGEKIFIGLRGPVLRGWAVILEVSIEKDALPDLRLKKTGPDDRRYKKHFLQLEGLGIRELCVQGSDLLILAGPTMELDEPVHIFRWKDGVNQSEEGLVFNKDLEKVLDVPYGKGKDHAEGMALVPDSDPPRILVVYDSPSDKRKEGGAGVRADVFDLPAGSGSSSRS
jgi:hypothetical protein